MKNLIVALLLLSLSAVGCAPQKQIIKTTMPPISSQTTAHIGDVFFEASDQTGWDDPILKTFFCLQCSRFNLIITELTNENIGLQYTEYFKDFGYPWMIKKGFTRQLRFSLADGVVNYKGYQFKVINTEDDKISYRRIK